MTTVKIKGYVYRSSLTTGEVFYHVHSLDSLGDPSYELVGPVEFDYTIPRELDKRVSELQAIEYTA